MNAPRYSATAVAVSGERFAHFAPYVPAVAEDGTVAFQASLAGGGTGVFIHDGVEVTTFIDSTGAGPVGAVSSHPDLGPAGRCCFYGSDRAGRAGVFVAEGAEVRMVAEAHGPLGPTVSSGGHVAYRATLGPGREGIFVLAGGASRLIAENGGEFAAFLGLPVVNREGAVVFRAELRDGGDAILLARADGLIEVARTGGEFTALSVFPWFDDAARVAFCGSRADGRSGVFVAGPGGVETLVDTRAGFESFRGVLLDGAGRPVFYATPRAGRLGVYAGPSGALVFGLGSPLMESVVLDFALNPVSMNSAGRFAARVELRDGRHAIVRFDPVG